MTEPENPILWGYLVMSCNFREDSAPQPLGRFIYCLISAKDLSPKIDYFDDDDQKAPKGEAQIQMKI